MMKLKACIIFLFVVCISKQSQAQYYFYNNDYYNNDWLYEAGASVGAMNSLTDLGGRKGIGKRGVKDFTIKNTNLCGSVYMGIIYRNEIALRLEGTFGKVRGFDSILAKVASTTNGRYERNLSFQSSITEISLIAEFHPIWIFGNFNQDHFPPDFSPYLLIGFGYFHFNPQAKLGNTWVPLQPLHTEGEGFAEYPDRKEYSLNQTNIPVGLGVKYELSAYLNVRAEFILRILQTDYLDDVHSRYIDPAVFPNYLSGTKLTQALILNNRYRGGLAPLDNTAHPGGIRGNPKNNDSYMSLNLKIGLVLGREKRFRGY